MIMFTIGAGDDLPTGISNNTTYTALADTTDPLFNTNDTYYIRLDDVIADGTSDVIPPVSGFDATNVELQAYHAQLNEEYILDPLDLIDSVDDMTPAQKTELRDAARVGFRNRVEITRIVNTDDTEIPDISSFPASGDDIIVMIRASGLAGVTRFVIDFDGNLHRTVTDAAILEALNSGDDVTLAITVPVSTIPGGYLNTTIVQVEFIEATTDFDLETAVLGDLLGAGRTVEAADLVVTPERVESAIHNTDSTGTARQDIRDTLDVYNKAEVDTLVGDAGDTLSLIHI